MAGKTSTKQLLGKPSMADRSLAKLMGFSCGLINMQITSTCTITKASGHCADSHQLFRFFLTDFVFFLNPCCIPLKIQYIYDNICVNKYKYMLVKPNLSAYLAWSGTLECFVVGVQSNLALFPLV